MIMKASLLTAMVALLAMNISLSVAGFVEPPRRPRAANVRLETNPQVLKPTPIAGDDDIDALPGPNLEVECAMRKVAFDMSMTVPTARRHARTIATSLQASQCNWFHTAVNLDAIELEIAESDSTLASPTNAAPLHHSLLVHTSVSSTANVFYVDCEQGSDDNSGEKLAPFLTLTKAQKAARSLIADGKSPVVIIREGVCYLERTFVLTELDSKSTWSSYNNESVVISAGANISDAHWKTYSGNVLVADLPENINASAIDSLFHVSQQGPGGNTSKRLIRARYPNGNSEIDRMPQNYDKLAGGSGRQEWRHAGNASLRFPAISRNSSYYPWFGHSKDIRWVLDYHTENQSSIFSPQSSFWQANVGTGAAYNTSTFSSKVTSWTNIKDGVAHVIHYDWWGNWQWRLDAINNTNHWMTFGDGGWQDAHGGFSPW